MQWKLPATFSNLIQRAGRTARGNGRIGLAVLLVERSAYSVNLCAGEHQPSRNTGKGKQQASTTKSSASKLPGRRSAAVAKTYAEEHGILRGSCACTDDIPTGQQPPLDLEAADEGLLAFVQSTSCRRRVWAEAFDNDPEKLAPTVPCCDICDPSLFDKTRPNSNVNTSREKVTRKGLPDVDLQDKLRRWRETIFERDLAGSPLAPSAVMDEEIIELISSLGPLSKEKLSSVLQPKWIWWDTYGEELQKLLATLKITFRPLSIKKRTKKTGTEEPDAQTEVYAVTWNAVDIAPVMPVVHAPFHGDVRFLYTEGTVVSDGTARMNTQNAPVLPTNTAAPAVALSAPTASSSTVPSKRRGRPRKEDSNRRIRAQKAGSDAVSPTFTVPPGNLPGPSTMLPVVAQEVASSSHPSRYQPMG